MENIPVPRPERESYIKHRREVTRHIIVPIALVTLLGILIAVLSSVAAAGANPAVSLWADISIIWLIIPIMLLALLIVALLIAMTQGMKRLLNIAPRYTSLAQAYAYWFNIEVRNWSQKITQPVLTIRTWLDLILKRED
jgi:hypothetical protein